MKKFNQPSPARQASSSVDNQNPPKLPGSALKKAANRSSRNLLINLPISQRLTLGFLIAALLATAVASIIGVQEFQSLSRQSNFYQNLLRTNTTLTTNSDFLQILNTQIGTTVADASVPNPSQETLKQDQGAITNLASRYDAALKGFIAKDLLTQHPEQTVLLSEVGQENLVQQQQTLAGSALRTWSTYQQAIAQIQQLVNDKQLAQAQALLHSQSEPTNADAQSALRSLIQFNGRLASTVHLAAAIEEQNQLVITIIGAFIAFLAILSVGWLISGTIVQRLVMLNRVTNAVETGHFNRRVEVKGNDEIAEVSASVNDMLETIVGLLDETRGQKDAMTNAAEHLFSDMRIVSAGDLRINAPVSNDPIGMLANAFNFTVGRFRRFVMRSQTSVEQIDVIAQQEIERSEVFIQTMGTITNQYANNPLMPNTPNNRRVNTGDLDNPDSSMQALANQMNQTRENLQKINNENILSSMRDLILLSEQSKAAISHIGQMISMQAEIKARGINRDMTQQQLQELRSIDNAITQISLGLRKTQQQTSQSINTIDAELGKMNQAFRSIQARRRPGPGGTFSDLSSEGERELLKVSLSYAQEILGLVRQISNISQEMRTSAIAFQLDTVPNPEENQRIEAPNPRNQRSLPPLEPPRRSISEDPYLR